MFKKRVLLVYYCLFLFCKLTSQEIPFELMLGQENFYGQYSVAKKAESKGIGFSNVSSFMLVYGQSRRSELMSQTYVTAGITSDLKVGIGMFYASFPSLKPSINLQYYKMYRCLVILIVPRIDLRCNPSTDLMLMTEFKPELTTGLKLYSRVQVMFSYNLPKHARSYQYFRLGFEVHDFQFGLGLNLDAYGETYNYYNNYGFFYKRKF